MADDDTDDDIRAGLRLLVDEGGPAASDEALREAMRRGRRKRRRKRLGAAAGVVVAVAGISAAAVTVPTVIRDTGQLRPATAPQWQTQTPEDSSAPEEPKQAYPTTEPHSKPPEKTATRTERPKPPELCPDYPNYESAEWFNRVPSVTVCPVAGDGAGTDFQSLLSSALSRASVKLRYEAGGTHDLRVDGADYATLISVNVRRYYGEPRPNHRPVQPGEPLIVLPDGSDTPANIARATPDPAALIYTHSGKLYIVRIAGPDPLPPEQLTAVVNALADAQG